MQFINIFTAQTVTPAGWQLALKPGDYYCIAQPVVAIVDLATGVAENYGLNDVPAVYGRIEKPIPNAPGNFWVKAYSQWSPKGESGLMCICDPTHLLTEEEFSQAKANGWPTTFERTTQS